jgi:hypothetical protein
MRILTRRRFLGESITAGMALGGAELLGLPLTGAPKPDNSSAFGLQVAGDASAGYSVALLFNGQPLARHNGAGEFSGVFQNEDRSVIDRVENWKAHAWSREGARITLAGECALKNLSAKVFVEVEYEIKTPQVVEKTVRLRQNDMLLIFYQLSNRLEAQRACQKLWSFDQPTWRGEALREYFPVAGFRTKDGVSVGLLTDSGYKNRWTRMIRRDGRPVKPAPCRIPDVNLYSGANEREQSSGQFFVEQTFGEVLAQTDNRGEALSLGAAAAWIKQGSATLQERDDTISLVLHQPEDRVLVPFAAEIPKVYTLGLEYRSAAPISLAIWNLDEQQRQVGEITQYNDTAPESPSEWKKYETTVLLSGLRTARSALVISAAASEQAMAQSVPAEGTKLELRGLTLRPVGMRSESYHRLEMARTEQKKVFIFADQNVADTVRGYRLASQLHLAEGLGLSGGDTEKVVYADLAMLTWIAGPESFRPILAPSIWYSAAGEMYLRDSFFALNGVHDRELNEGVWNLWADNQGEDGAINTLLEPNLANLERKSNDSTPLWLMWALLNRRRFATVLPADRVRKAAEYCLRTFDPQGKGECWAQFVMGQLDVIRYPGGTSAICENQGLWAVTLRVIKELQVPGVSKTISEERIAQAEELYRSYYDPALKFFRPARDIGDAIGFAEIFPEYLSLWLFGRKILTDAMVINHLGRIPTLMPHKDCPHPEEGGTVRAILIGLPKDGRPWSYFDETWHPMISDSFAQGYAKHAADGIYYNGGSWMRIEICGYVTGKLHGWNSAPKAIRNRLWAEINAAPEFPTSQEYLATDRANPFFGFHRVFAWNSFILQALELAGMRRVASEANKRKPVSGLSPEYQ